jgi:hypothetical protein
MPMLRPKQNAIATKLYDTVELEHDPEKCEAVFHATNAKRLRGDHAQSRS